MTKTHGMASTSTRGYATVEHIGAVARFGYSAVHRRSFRPRSLFDRIDHAACEQRRQAFRRGDEIERFSRALVVIYFLEAGLILTIAPWTRFWERNYLVESGPLTETILTSGIVRGERDRPWDREPMCRRGRAVGPPSSAVARTRDGTPSRRGLARCRCNRAVPGSLSPLLVTYGERLG